MLVHAGELVDTLVKELGAPRAEITIRRNGDDNVLVVHYPVVSEMVDYTEVVYKSKWSSMLACLHFNTQYQVTFTKENYINSHIN